MVELMIAVFILSVGLLGLFQTVYSMIAFNRQNDLRSAAVAYGDEVMAHELDRPFDGITTSQGQMWSSGTSASRSINGDFSFSTFSAVRSHAYVSPSSTNVQVRVSWRYKGTQYNHNLASVVSK